MEEEVVAQQNRELIIENVLPARQVGNKDGFEHTVNLTGTSAATAANYSTIYNVDRACELIRVRVSYTNASSSGTLMLERLTGTTAPGSGDNILVTTISLSSTANTIITRQKTDLQNTILRPGDRVAIEDGGTLTNLQNLVITLYYTPIGKGNYQRYA